MTAQVTWRADDELVDRVRHAARAWGWSVNEYVTRVLDAATDPAHAADDTERLRERLSRAGLLAAPGAPRTRPPHAAVQRARRAASDGTPLSDFVHRGRE